MNVRLGPVIEGGTLELGFTALGQDLMPYQWEVEIDDPSILTALPGSGAFGPSSMDGRPIYVVDGFVILRGEREGTTYVNIVDSYTGDLFDRLQMTVLPVDDVRVVRLSDRESTELPAGQNELLGIRLVVDGGTREIRAIDQSLAFRATGAVQPELMYWDCFEYAVPTEPGPVEFEVHAAGQVFYRTFTIVEDPASTVSP